MHAQTLGPSQQVKCLRTDGRTKNKKNQHHRKPNAPMLQPILYTSEET